MAWPKLKKSNPLNKLSISSINKGVAATQKGISNAWTGGEGKLGVRDAAMVGGAYVLGGPIAAGAVGAGVAANKSAQTAAKQAGGAGGVPSYETPPAYEREAGVTASAAQMADNSNTWGTLATNKQKQEEAMQIDKINRTGQAGLAQARSGLAMRGGLRGGAGERMAGQALEQQQLNAQVTRGQGAADRMGIGMKQADMSTEIGKYNATNQQAANLQNASNMMTRETNVNNNNFNTYTELMKQKGADYAATMQAKAASKPTLLGDPFGYAKENLLNFKIGK